MHRPTLSHNLTRTSAFSWERLPDSVVINRVFGECFAPHAQTELSLHRFGCPEGEDVEGERARERDRERQRDKETDRDPKP